MVNYIFAKCYHGFCDLWCWTVGPSCASLGIFGTLQKYLPPPLWLVKECLHAKSTSLNSCCPPAPALAAAALSLALVPELALELVLAALAAAGHLENPCCHSCLAPISPLYYSALSIFTQSPIIPLSLVSWNSYILPYWTPSASGRILGSKQSFLGANQWILRN